MVVLREMEEYVERINDACSICHEMPTFKISGEEGKQFVFKRGTEVVFISKDSDEMFACVSYVWQFYKRFRLGIINK